MKSVALTIVEPAEAPDPAGLQPAPPPDATTELSLSHI